MNKAERKLEVKKIMPFSTKELSSIYGVTSKTFLNWIKPHAEQIGQKRGRYYSVVQVELIFDKLGIPFVITEDI